MSEVKWGEVKRCDIYEECFGSKDGRGRRSVKVVEEDGDVDEEKKKKPALEENLYGSASPSFTIMMPQIWDLTAKFVRVTLDPTFPIVEGHLSETQSLHKH